MLFLQTPMISQLCPEVVVILYFWSTKKNHTHKLLVGSEMGHSYHLTMPSRVWFLRVQPSKVIGKATINIYTVELLQSNTWIFFFFNYNGNKIKFKVQVDLIELLVENIIHRLHTSNKFKRHHFSPIYLMLLWKQLPRIGLNGRKTWEET